MTFNFRDEVKDSITGFKGVVTGIFSYINGCVRIEVQPEKLDKNGDPASSSIIDSAQLTLIKAAKRAADPVARGPGGPQPTPSQPKDPRR